MNTFGKGLLVVLFMVQFGIAWSTRAQEPAPNPTWKYSIDEKDGELSVTVSASRLRTDEQIDKAVCYFNIEGSENAFAVESVPIRSGTEITEVVYTLSGSQQETVGLRMYWEVGVAGRSLSWLEEPVRSGTTEPEANSDKEKDSAYKEAH